MVGLEGGRRLAELLTSGGDQFVLLKQVSISDLAGAGIETFPELPVDKSEIIAAVPFETPEELRQQQARRTGLPRPHLMQVPVVALLPPLVIRGTAYLPPPASVVRAQMLGQFFTLTHVRMRLPSGESVTAEVMVVNRDRLGGITKLTEAA
jgi:hypothetical protein